MPLPCPPLVTHPATHVAHPNRETGEAPVRTKEPSRPKNRIGVSVTADSFWKKLV